MPEKATDADVQAQIDAMDADISSQPAVAPNFSGTGFWDLMNTSPGRTYLWRAYPFDSSGSASTYSSNITNSYNRLLAMITAYYTRGSAFYGKAALLNDAISGLDWLYTTNKYSPSTVPASGANWFDYQIGAPKPLTKIMLIAQADLSKTQLANYAASVDHFVPTPQSKTVTNSPTMTGSNLLDQALSVAYSGIVSGGSKLNINNANDDTADARISSASEAMWKYNASNNPYPPLLYKKDNASLGSTRDGFYSDGSYIAHNSTAFIGGYGTLLLTDVGLLLHAFEGTPWAVSDGSRWNAYRWVFDSAEPFIYNGRVMDAVRGRSIASGPKLGPKPDYPTTNAGTITAIFYLSLTAPTTNANLGSEYASDPRLAMNSMLKYWVETDANGQILGASSLYAFVKLKAMLTDASIPSRGELLTFQLFSNQDRAVQQRPTYAYELSTSSKRTNKWESGTGQNGRGWYVSDGMMYLYNSDTGKYFNFWQTVNPYRLPGTTVDTQTRSFTRNWTNYVADPAVIPGATALTWVGGVNLADMKNDGGFYGVVGMDHRAPGDIVTGTLGSDGSAGKGVIGTTSDLVAKKSWFFFDDEMVSLGSGITSSTTEGLGWDGGPRRVETIVENHKLNVSGSNVLTVNGSATSLSWTTSNILSATNWLHLQGNVNGNGGSVGYYFPSATDITARRDARTGDYTAVDPTYSTTLTCPDNADTYYRSMNTPTNYGTNTTIDVKNDSGTFYREGYVKIDLTNYIRDANVSFSSAMLQLTPVTVGTATNITHAAELVSDNSWTEASLTSSLASTPLSPAQSWSNPVQNTKVCIDITNAVLSALAAGNNVLSFKIRATNAPDTNSHVSYASKESANETYRPKVVFANYKEPVTTNFATMWIDHGAKPTSAAYEYVTLPGISAGAVGGYAAVPDVTVIRNETDIQAVAERTLGIVGANFWQDASNTLLVDGQSFVTADKKCSLMTQETQGVLQLSISDPTQVNTGVINIDINRAWSGLTSDFVADPGIAVNQTSPTTIKLTVTPNADPTKLGRTLHAVFNTVSSSSLNATGDTYVRDGASSTTNFGSGSTFVVKADASGFNRKSFIKFDVSGYSGTAKKAFIAIYPVSVPSVTTINQASVVSSSWSESTLTWDTPITVSSAVYRWTVPALNQPVYLDVTSQVQAAVTGSNKIVAICISSLTADSNASTSYGSREYAVANYRPRLTIK